MALRRQGFGCKLPAHFLNFYQSVLALAYSQTRRGPVLVERSGHVPLAPGFPHTGE
jgi:hypothetical protein